MKDFDDALSVVAEKFSKVLAEKVGKMLLDASREAPDVEPASTDPGLPSTEGMKGTPSGRVAP